MKVVAVDFVRSAAGPDDFPKERWPQVALVGRSNVGKSSLLNALTRRSVARTSALRTSAPGRWATTWPRKRDCGWLEL